MIRSLFLSSLRNLHEGRWEFGDGITVIAGKNGTGKTTLLEAIHLLCEGFSFRTHSLSDLLSWNEPEMILRGELAESKESDRVFARALLLNRNTGIVVKKDGILCKSPASFFGEIPAVIMQPADLEMVRGAPENRRRYLDELLCFKNVRNADLLRRYRRILAERNQWLKLNKIGKAVGGEELHSVLTQQLMDLGVKIWMERMALVQEISPLIVRYYEMLAGIGDEVAVSYKSAVFDFLREKELSEEILRDAFAHKLEVLDFSERMQGLTLSGPHKDDLLLSLHGHEMRSSGSQGQCRSAAIALRLSASDLASRHLIKPVLLLDDIFAELDKNRRAAVAGVIREKKCQVFVATPRIEDLPFSADEKIEMGD